MHIRRLSVGIVIAVLLSGNAIAGGLEDCAAAFDRQDYTAAHQLCRPLAEQGDARAQTSLAGMYYSGQGVQRDYAEAAKWVRKAAEQGYAPAQADLGVLYWNGQGVPQDAVLAYMWLHLAAAQEPDAVGKRDAAASQMTPDEIAEAQRLAREWKPTRYRESGMSVPHGVNRRRTLTPPMLSARAVSDQPVSYPQALK